MSINLGNKLKIVGALLVAVLSVGAQAQSHRVVAKMSVPFAFHYGSQVLPAGQYVVAIDSNVFMKVSSHSRTGVGMIRWEQSEAGAKGIGKASFRQSEGEYYFRALTTPELGARIECVPVRHKRSWSSQREQAEVADRQVDVAVESAGN